MVFDSVTKYAGSSREKWGTLATVLSDKTMGRKSGSLIVLPLTRDGNLLLYLNNHRYIIIVVVVVIIITITIS